MYTGSTGRAAGRMITTCCSNAKTRTQTKGSPMSQTIFKILDQVSVLNDFEQTDTRLTVFDRFQILSFLHLLLSS
jgi:hypothetical protein